MVRKLADDDEMLYVRVDVLFVWEKNLKVVQRVRIDLSAFVK